MQQNFVYVQKNACVWLVMNYVSVRCCVVLEICCSKHVINMKEGVECDFVIQSLKHIPKPKDLESMKTAASMLYFKKCC